MKHRTRCWVLVSLLFILPAALVAQTGSWTSKAPLPHPRSAAASGVIDGVMILSGGVAEDHTLATEAYDAVLDTWNARADTLRRRSYATTGVIDGKLYVAGGCMIADCSAGVSGALDIYDAATNSWSSGPAMPTPRGGASGAVAGGKFYVIGGFLSCGDCAGETTVEVYDPALNVWTTGASMPTARCYAGATSIGSRIYVAGGRSVTSDPIATLEIFDTVSGAWSSGAPMPTPRHGFGIAPVAGTFYTIAGRNASSATSVVEHYDPVANSWSSMAPIPRARSVPNAEAVSGRIVVAGSGEGDRSAVDVFTPPDYGIPRILSFTPASGSTASVITIDGSFFTGATSVAFNGIVAAFTVVDDARITATVPAGATTGPISVTTPGGTATSATSFTISPAPAIGSFSPVAGEAGTQVTILGTNFNGATAVRFGVADAAFVVDSNSQIRATVPAAANSGLISVQTPAGWGSSSEQFTVIHPPTISSFTPASGGPGTVVTIQGTDFVSVTAVTFNNLTALYTVVSSSRIDAVVPESASSGPIRVTTAQGVATSAASFSALAHAPTVSSIAPTYSYAPGGGTFTISGSYFQNGLSIEFGGAPATIASVTQTVITGTVPAHAPGSVGVVVRNPDGQAAAALGFVYYSSSFQFVEPLACGATGSSIGVTVMLGSAASGDVNVAITSGNPSIVEVPANVVIPAGKSSITFNVKTLAAGSTTLSAVASGVSQTATASIRVEDGVTRGDVLTIGSVTAAGPSLTIPVHLRDVSGTPLDVNRATNLRIAKLLLRVNYTPAAAVASIAFQRAGATSANPITEVAYQSAGSLTWNGTFSSLPLTLNATGRGNLVGNLVVTLASAAPGTVVSLDFDRLYTRVANSSGDVAQSAPSRDLALVSGRVSVPTLTGDANNDASTNVADVFVLINNVFAGGAAPAITDVNGDGILNASDVFFLVNYLFGGGQAPGVSLEAVWPGIASAIPYSVLPVTVVNASASERLSARFAAGAFSLDVPLITLPDGGRGVVVPPIGLTEHRESDVTVSIVSSARTSNSVVFHVAAPPLSPRPAGELAARFLRDADAYASSLELRMRNTPLDDPTLVGAVSSVGSNAGTLASKIESVIQGVTPSFTIGSIGDVSITVTSSDLAEVDRGILAMLAALGRSGTWNAKMAPNFTAGCMKDLARMEAYATLGNQPPQYGTLYQMSETCGPASAFNESFTVIGASAGIGLGVLSLAGVPAMATALPEAAILYATLTSGAGLIGVGGALGQASEAGRLAVEAGVEKVNSLLDDALEADVLPETWGEIYDIFSNARDLHDALANVTPAQLHDLTLSTSGSGSGTIDADPPGLRYTAGSVVVLTATPASGSHFREWGGACAGTSAVCSVTMTSSLVVSARFEKDVALLVGRAGTGNGTVTSSPAGINCGFDCTEIYDAGQTVALTATPSQDSEFVGWSGGCSGNGGCTVTLNADVAVTATFDRKTPRLTVAKGGTGTGTVTSSPSGINCGSDCDQPYSYGTVVTLTATASGGSQFAGWSGACSGTSSCSVTMDAAKSVTATFNTVVGPAGSWSGTHSYAGTGTAGCYFSSSGPFTMNLTVSGSTFSGTATLSSILFLTVDPPTCAFNHYESGSGSVSGTWSGNTFSGTINATLSGGGSWTVSFDGTFGGKAASGTLTEGSFPGTFSLTR